MTRKSAPDGRNEAVWQSPASAFIALSMSELGKRTRPIRSRRKDSDRGSCRITKPSDLYRGRPDFASPRRLAGSESGRIAKSWQESTGFRRHPHRPSGSPSNDNNVTWPDTKRILPTTSSDPIRARFKTESRRKLPKTFGAPRAHKIEGVYGDLANVPAELLFYRAGNQRGADPSETLDVVQVFQDSILHLRRSHRREVVGETLGILNPRHEQAAFFPTIVKTLPASCKQH